jgi:hypothetical protein
MSLIQSSRKPLQRTTRPVLDLRCDRPVKLQIATCNLQCQINIEVDDVDVLLFVSLQRSIGWFNYAQLYDVSCICGHMLAVPLYSIVNQ